MLDRIEDAIRGSLDVAMMALQVAAWLAPLGALWLIWKTEIWRAWL